MGTNSVPAQRVVETESTVLNERTTKAVSELGGE